MAVTFVGQGALASNATVATQAIPAHASTAVDDILIAQILNKSVTANTVTPPDGTWTAVIATEVNDCTTATHDHQFSVFWKRCTVAGAQNYTFTKATDDNVLFGGIISSWRGCPTTGSPLDATAAARTKTAGAADNVSFPSFDPTVPSHVIYMSFYGIGTPVTFGAMSGTVNPNCTVRYSTTPLAVTSGDNDGAAIASRTWASGSTTDAGSTGVVFALVPAPLAILANDVESDPTVSNPAAVEISGGPTVCLANDVLSPSSVQTGSNFKQLHGILANDVISTSDVPTPAVKALHGLLANDVISTSDVPTPTVGLIGVLVKPFAEDVVSTPVVSKPSQLKQLQVILANDVKSTSDERLVAPATNAFYPVAFYGVAFEHLPITNVLVVTDTADVLASVVVTNFGLLANDVISTSDVPTPVAAVTRVCLANDVISTSDVPTPAAVITRAALANDVLSPSSVTKPTQLRQLHGLLANDVLSPSSVTNPNAAIQRIILANDVLSPSSVTKPTQLKQLHGLLANDVISTSDVPTPAAIIRRDVLANDVLSPSLVTKPSLLKQLHGLLAENVISLSSVSQQNVFSTYVLFAENVTSVPAVSRPSQLKQLQGILANDVKSASDERLVAPATNGFYPAAFYGKAFDHLPAANVLTVVDTADVLASVVVGRFDVTANDVQSNSSVSQPVALINRVVLANDVISTSKVTNPLATIRRDLLANDVISTSDVPTPAASITRNYLANDVISNSSVTQPIALINRVCLANDVKSNSSVAQIYVATQWGLFAENIVSPSKVTTPSQLHQLQGILANDVKSTPFLRLVAPATNGFYPAAFYGVAFDHLPATNALAAVDIVDVLAAAVVGLADVHANDVISTSKVTNPFVGIIGIAAGRDLVSASSVSKPSMLRQQSFFADDVVSASKVTTPSQLHQMQVLLADDAKSTPFLRLVAPATNGFYPAAFYGVAFDHLPAANVLAAVETADVLAVAAIARSDVSASYVVSGSSVSKPSLLQPQTLAASDVISASSVSRPSQLHQLQLIAANDVVSAPFLRLVAPATNGFYPAAFYGVAFDHLPAANVLVAVDTADTLAATALMAVEAFSRGPISPSLVSRPSQLQQRQVIDAGNITSHPFVVLVAPATNGFYPTAFYGAAFDHLPAANVLAAIETADMLDMAAFTSGAGTARDLISTSSVSKPTLHMRQALLADDVISRPFVQLVEGATNGFNPAAFYGVAFDHLPAANVLAATEDAVDTFALTALMAVRAFANDVISTPFTLLVKPATNGFNPAAFYGVAFDHLPATNVLAAVDDIDVMSGAEGELLTGITAELLEEPDVVSFDAVTLDILYADLDTFDEPDVLTAKTGRWDFRYGVDEGIRVAWEKQVVAIGSETPEDGDVSTVDVFIGFYGSAFDQYGFFSGYAGFTYDTTDADLIHVAWEEQELVALGRPRAPPRPSPPIVIPPPAVPGFYGNGFYGLAFFTFAEVMEEAPAPAQGYDDDEAIVVPPSYVIERLRENTTSYVAPRRKV